MTQPRSILIVEDDPSTRMLLAHTFEGAGWRVHVAGDLALARREFVTNPDVDLVLLDMVLPSGDGRELLQSLRQAGPREVPIMLMTGRANQRDRVDGLWQGADDVLTKPFDHHELLARVEAVLRRYKPGATDSEQAAGPLMFGPLSIDPVGHQAAVNGVPVALTAREFSLLLFLARHAGTVFTRADLLREVWNSSPDWQTPATVTEHIRKLREKLVDAAGSCPWIITVRGVGYRFDDG